MERKQRAKMPKSQRAKQFMPFTAVKGLEKAIAEQDDLLNRTEQVELDDEQVQTINETLSQLKKGCTVSVCFYSDGHYSTVTGAVEQIIPEVGIVSLVGLKIPFKNIKALARARHLN